MKGVLLAVVLGALCAASSAHAQNTWRASLSSGNLQGNSGSFLARVSDDGRFVAFESFASNLVPADMNFASDIMVRDRQTGQTTRVSIATGGVEGNGGSVGCCLSADGRFVAFTSNASNLVADDTNGRSDIFVHDRQTGQTSRVSVASDAAEGDGDSRECSLSLDGRFVVLVSLSTNLIPDGTDGTPHVYLHDRQTGETTLISVSSDGMHGNGTCSLPVVSADGRFVAFTSEASNLVLNDANEKSDVFVHDRQTGLTTRVSVASDSTEGDDESFGVCMSADGRFVSFTSHASNLVAGDGNNRSDVFVHDRQIGETHRVSVASDGTEGNHHSISGSISADGRYVALDSTASNLVANDTNDAQDLFVRDRLLGRTTRVSVAAGGVEADSFSYFASISPNGRYVAFSSIATNLVPGDSNGWSDAFVHDRCESAVCPGDANRSGFISFADITSVLEHWGFDYTPCSGLGDANFDSLVAFADVTRILEFWGVPCP